MPSRRTTRRPKADQPPIEDLDALISQRVSDLRALWTTVGRSGEPPGPRHVLLRDLAWSTQQRAHGGLDAPTKRLLRDAVRRAPSGSRERSPQKQRPAAVKDALAPGVRLVRRWRGAKYEVTVLEGSRFRFRDEEYGSLSEIAREITGTRWSGPRFFGLDKLGGMT
ncbi:MAG: DUF2924 domain-containing protein [Planctomycetota bacterium]